MQLKYVVYNIFCKVNERDLKYPSSNINDTLFLIMIILSQILSRNGVNKVFVDITNAFSLGSFKRLYGCKHDHFFTLKLFNRFQRDFFSQGFEHAIK